uniref:Uncharacterized protein n=1 Tax=Anguilla anguilla TaxID=7936 RepID=A0A0E9T9I7_ANGAN
MTYICLLCLHLSNVLMILIMSPEFHAIVYFVRILVEF